MNAISRCLLACCSLATVFEFRSLLGVRDHVSLEALESDLIHVPPVRAVLPGRQAVATLFLAGLLCGHHDGVASPAVGTSGGAQSMCEGSPYRRTASRGSRAIYAPAFVTARVTSILLVSPVRLRGVCLGVPYMHALSLTLSARPTFLHCHRSSVHSLLSPLLLPCRIVMHGRTVYLRY